MKRTANFRFPVRAGYLTAALTALLGVGLLANGAAVSAGVRYGMELCAGVLIPSLFPFMALCCYLTLSDSSRILSLPLRPLTTRVFRLPAELGAPILLSLIGGYPVGAKMTANLLAQGRIDQKTAERMLCVCVNCSPSFLISAVGAGMLINRRAGAALYASQTLATLLVGALASLRAPRPEGKRPLPRMYGGAGAFVHAVTDASSAMLTMCAFEVLLSGLLALLRELGLIGMIAGAFPVSAQTAEALAAGFFDVTAGCLAASRLGGEQAILLISLCCSFGGLSIIFQIMSCFGREKLRFWPFLLCRLAHLGVAAAIGVPLYRLLCADAPAWMPHTPPPVPHSNLRTVVITLCLLAMCSILVLYADRRGHKRKSG